MFCTKCGAPNLETEKYCANCGTLLEPTSTDPNAQPVAGAVTAQQPNAGQPIYTNVYMNSQPVAQLKTNRSLWKFVLLSIVTFGIYLLVYFSSVSSDINVIASRYDGKKTMHFCLLFFIVSPLTCGIASLVWYHNISSRIGSELKRRGMSYSFGAADFWLWNILGTLILVGPFIYIHKMSKAMNLLADNFNHRG